MDQPPCPIDDVGPFPVVQPPSVADVGEVVRCAAADNHALYPTGGRTMLDYGLPPARPGVAIELRALDKIIDFPARDMTITVEAGITVARLNEITRAEGLHLPIDVPEPERATLGGAIACNVSGPRRYGYGTFRDYVLGITTVNDRGELVSAGGRVVKNVAGYDLMKLHTGALGTLGVITQVTLRLKPMPEAWVSRQFDCPKNRLADALERINRSNTRPARVDFCRVNFFENDSRNQWRLAILFEGNSDAVSWQERQLRSEFTANAFGDIDDARGKNPRGTFERPENPLVLRAELRPSAAAEFCQVASSRALMAVDGWCAGAVVRCKLMRADWTEGDTAQFVNQLFDIAEPAGGNVIIAQCPSEWKKSLPVWGRPPADLALQKAVKRALDPKNLFNPGRFVTDAF